jgi:hypothetical protein
MTNVVKVAVLCFETKEDQHIGMCDMLDDAVSGRWSYAVAYSMCGGEPSCVVILLVFCH